MRRFFRARWLLLVAVLVFLAALIPTSGPELAEVTGPSDFRHWSNSKSQEKSLDELARHLQGMDSLQDVVAWFEDAGFRVNKSTPRELSSLAAKRFGYPDGTYYSLVFTWQFEDIGSIFVTNGFARAWYWLIVQGQGLSFHYRLREGKPGSPIVVMSMRVSATIN
ncbi:MAG: hypothetical protein HKN18_02135 [Silicimonas sp.]|nr:hypothetical protein [Silicimonas sp.]